MSEKFIQTVNTLRELTQCVKNSDDSDETVTETLTHHFKQYVKTVKTHLHLTDCFSEH